MKTKNSIQFEKDFSRTYFLFYNDVKALKSKIKWQK